MKVTLSYLKEQWRIFDEERQEFGVTKSNILSSFNIFVEKIKSKYEEISTNTKFLDSITEWVAEEGLDKSLSKRNLEWFFIWRVINSVILKEMPITKQNLDKSFDYWMSIIKEEVYEDVSDLDEYYLHEMGKETIKNQFIESILDKDLPKSFFWLSIWNAWESSDNVVFGKGMGDI